MRILSSRQYIRLAVFTVALGIGLILGAALGWS